MIDKIALPVKAISATANSSKQETSAAELSGQFGKYLNDAMNQLNNTQQTVEKLNEQFVKGELSDVHQMLIASEKASLGLELTVQVRNKVIEAYQEVMRMQV